MASSVFWTLAKAMFKQGSNSMIEIPNFAYPQIKYIFELPFEFRLGVAFVGTWVGAIAFDHVTDILEKKYIWVFSLLIIILLCYLLKSYIGIGPTSEDLLALFDEDREETEVLSKKWKQINCSDEIRLAVGKLVAIQWVSKEYGNLYLTDEKKAYFTFAKKIEEASKFQLISIPSSNGINTVAFFSESRKQYITNSMLGYLKVDANRVSAWEKFHLDFITDKGVTTGMFQLQSVSRGRHIMHLKEGNNHKGFHDKYGEIAHFKILYLDTEKTVTRSVTQEVPLVTKEPIISSVQSKNSVQRVSLPSSDSEEEDSMMTASTTSIASSICSANGKQEISAQALSVTDLRDQMGSPTSGWQIITKQSKYPFNNPVALYVEGEGFLKASLEGSVSFTDKVDEGTHFQVCGIPNDSAIAFFSRSHHKYLSLSGLFANKLMVSGAKFDNWEKFRVKYFDQDNMHRCHLKVMKTLPPPAIKKHHLLGNKLDRTRAVFVLVYNEYKSI
jgi:hypothetical protein